MNILSGLTKLLIILTLSASLLASAQPSQVVAVQDKHEFCQGVALNVMAGHDLKGQIAPPELDILLQQYAVQLQEMGMTKFQIEQLSRAVLTGYTATKNANLLAEREFGRCMAQKET